MEIYKNAFKLLNINCDLKIACFERETCRLLLAIM